MSKKEEFTKSLQEIKACFNECLPLCETKVCCDSEPCHCCDAEYYYSDLCRSLEYIKEEIYFLREKLYQHIEKGHIPPVKSGEQLDRIIKLLGLDSDYEVKKEKIYASDGTPIKKQIIISAKL